jgi:prepilin-type N-terminal cleavage/methylation domain-containing protein
MKRKIKKSGVSGGLFFVLPTLFPEYPLDFFTFFWYDLIIAISKTGTGKMKNRSGFTILELLIAISIMGTLSAIAIPNMITWRNNAQFNGAVNTLAGDLAVAKQSAIRNNAAVVITFTNMGYTIFIDTGDGAGGVPNSTQDADERALRSRILPNGVAIDLGASTFAGNFTQFNGTGRCNTANVGRVVISQGSGQSSVAVNRLGRVSII